MPLTRNPLQLNVSQNTEPAEMVFVLGGQLVTRQVCTTVFLLDLVVGSIFILHHIQGTRTHWSRENTAMHVVRSTHGLIYIDEVELVSPVLSYPLKLFIYP